MATGVTVIEYQQFKQKATRFLLEQEIQMLIDFTYAKMPLHLLNVYKIGEKDPLAKVIGVAFECLQA